MATSKERLRRVMMERGLKQIDVLRLCEPYAEELGEKIDPAYLSEYLGGTKNPSRKKCEVLAKALNVTVPYIMGFDDDEITTALPVETESLILSDIDSWDGETVEVPNAFFRGHSAREFRVIKVMDDSMAPNYIAGDLVLVFLQSTAMDDEDAICCYDGEKSTLKKVYFGEDKVTLKPINEKYDPIEIKGEDLENFHVLGKAVMLLRNI